MDPRTLFKPGLTVPEHEIRDLHYIGEALPVPSLITTSISVEADANTGGSPVPAREDHVHAVDVDSLIQFINDHPTEIDLTNYYTKAEVDQMLDELIVGGEVDLNNYYTKAQTDALDTILADAIDALDVRVTALELQIGDFTVQWLELPWSYGTVVAPEALTVLGRYDAFKAFKITEIAVSLVVVSSTDYVIKLWHQTSGSGGYSLVETVTIAAGNVFEVLVLSVPLEILANDQLEVSIDTQSSGTGEILTVIIRGFYVA